MTPTYQSLVGVWRLETEGAPYPDHLATYQPNGTWAIHNPTNVEQEPDQGGLNDSIGMGLWWPDHPLTGEYIAMFWQLNADANNHRPLPDLRVGFRLHVDPHNRDRLSGTALAQSGDGEPRPATVRGQRLAIDPALIPPRAG